MENTFGSALRAERERRGWSPTQMAQFLGISFSHLKTLESGTNPRIDTADRIAKGLGMRVVLGDETSRRRLG